MTYIYINQLQFSPFSGCLCFFSADWRFDLAGVRNVSLCLLVSSGLAKVATMNNCINILSGSSHLVMSTLD
jgi:hypothetical protein